jgi:hypothetical protein
VTAIRRIYLYVVTFAALATLGLGVANLVRALLEAWVSTMSATSPGYLQDQVALWGAAALVGLPVWALHWLWAQRLTADTAERRSPLRRLFLYSALAGALVVGIVALDEALPGLVMALVGGPVALARVAVPPLPLLLVAAGVWVFHWRVASSDRAAVGEAGASATLRRWYLYGLAFVGLLFLLMGAQMALLSTWLTTTGPTAGYAARVPGVRAAVIGLLLFGMHWVSLPRALDFTTREQDRRSTLRGVYLFLGLAVALLGTLSGISQALYYMLARVLGVNEPGGVGGSLLQAAGGPLSVAIVYGAAWLYQAHVISGLQHELDAPRQLGVRRLYEHLTALVALTVLAVGLTGLVWMLGDAISHAPDTVGSAWWRDRVSLFATLAIVGLPVWLLHWHSPRPTDTRSLVRRVYLYVSLTAAVLALLGSGAAAIYRLLGLVLGSVNASTAIVDLSHAIAVAVVAAGLSAYHWRMTRIDMLSPAVASSAAAPAQAVVELGAPTAAAIDAALEALRRQGISVHRRAVGQA